MFYRFRPMSQADWIDFPDHALVTRLEQEYGKKIDLDALDWKPAERQLDDETLQLLLRYGLATTTGIAIDVRHLIDLNRARTMRANHAEMVAHRPVYQAELEKLKPMVPWILDGEDELNARVDDSVQRSIREAEQEVAHALEEPAKLGLVKHWQRLGGELPEPL